MRRGSDRRLTARRTQRSASSRLLAIARWLFVTLSLQITPGYGSDGKRPGIPDISYPDLADRPHNLQEWKGRVLLLNFWASWCSPCLAEIKHLVEFQRKYGPLGLQVVGLGLDEPRKLRNVQRSLQINYPVLHAEPKQSHSILKSWGNKTGLIPYSVIFDSEGRIIQAHRGIIDQQLFETIVKPLLAPETE